MLVREPLGGDAAILAGEGPEHRTPRDPSEFEPGLEHGDGAGEGRGAAADLDLAPAGLAVEGQKQAAAVSGRRRRSRSSRFRRPSAPGRSRGRRSPSGAGRRRTRWRGWPCRAGRAGRCAGRQHGQKLVGEDRLLLDRRAAMGAADAGQHGGDMGSPVSSRRPSWR